MPNFEENQSPNVSDRRDEIRDPTDISSLFRSGGGYGGGILSPVDAAINIGRWFNKAVGNKPPNDQVPEDSMAGQAGYNAIGRGYEDGGTVDDQPALPRTGEGQDTSETPNTMMDQGGVTGTSEPQKSSGGIEWFPQASEKDKTSNPDLASYLFHKVTGQGQSPPDEGQNANEEEQANQSPLAPRNLLGLIPKTNTLAHSIINYAAQLYSGNPQGLVAGDKAMDQNTAGALINKVNPDGAHPSESEAALQFAHDRGGPDAALGFMQNRVANYNNIRAWVTAAYDGGNLQAAIDGGNRAFKMLPLSENIHFSLGDNGTVNTTLIDPKGGDPVHFSLTGSQYRELMRGNSGFPYDFMSDPAGTLAKLSSENHDMWADPNSEGVKPGIGGRVPDSLKAMGVNQATYNVGMDMFPWSNQNAQRNAFFLAQIQQKEKYAQELKVAQQQGLNRAQVAAVTGQYRQGVAETNVEGRKEVEGMRGETQRDIANTRGNNYHERTIVQAKTANDKLLAQPGQEADKDRAAQRHIVLGQLMKGTVTQDEADAMLKKTGDSLKALLGPYQPQQAPTAGPQVQGGQGAAQVARPNPPAANNQTQPQGGGKAPPKVGEVRNGYRFLGGSPADKASWEPQ